MEKKHDLQTLKEMSEREMEICMGVDCEEAKLTKRGVLVSVGIGEEYGQKLMKSMATGDGKYAAVLIIVNMDQFKKVSVES